jgi:2-phospho-L-lactate guanylyltransferase
VSERIVAVVPIRSLRDGKSRLAAILSAETRAALQRRVAERVIGAARASGVVQQLLVVSPDPEALAWATSLGASVVPLPQPAAQPGLNGAIEAGREWALAQSATAVLSLFADLPLLSAEEIRRMAGRPEPVVLGPDRRGEGTNALLLRLADAGRAFRFAFGEGSLARHEAEAGRLGLPVAYAVSPGIGFDLDTPDDWTDLLDVVCGDGAVSADLLAPDGMCAG